MAHDNRSTDERAAVVFSMRQGDRCRNYGPEHERTENENCIVTLADEIERLRAAMAQACSDMGCFCRDDRPQEKCPMCKLEAVLQGSAADVTPVLDPRNALREFGRRVFAGGWVDHAAECPLGLGVDDDECLCGLSDWLKQYGELLKP